jgi:serine/threonine protein kinase
VAKNISKELPAIVQKAFPGLSMAAERAPQGQNSFCHNLRMQDAKGRQFLIKAVKLSGTTIDKPAETLEEVQAAAAVRSQYFVPLIEAKSASGFALMQFPFLDGENLADYVARKGGTLPEQEAVEMGISLLRGVADLSRYGIRHQDIKPENIFITSSGDVKILDFGSARFRKLSFKGSTRTNRSHSAPEQILASKPANLEALRLTCDERTDVYSVASVLYQVVEGVPPFASNDHKLEGGPPRSFDKDVSDGFKRIVNRLLNYNPRNRPHATQAISFLESGDVQPPIVSRGGFFYNASTSLKRLQEVHHGDDTLFNGIIVDASRLPASDQEYLRSGPLSIIIDPQTYLFQAPKLINAKFKKLPYYRFGKSGGDDVGVEYITDVDGLVNSTFDFEIAAGADILLPPFFLIKEFNDLSWTFDAEATHRSLAIYEERGLQLPLFKGVAIAENVLLGEKTRGLLIDHLTTTDWQPHIAGYMVLFESLQKNGLPSEEWLSAAKEVINSLLSTTKVVIWSHAALPGITFAHSGVGLGMGEAQSQKSFSMSEDKPEMKKKSPHFYLPKLFARIKWPSGFIALNTHKHPRLPDFVCEDVCCTGVDFADPSKRDEKDLAIHMIRQLALQFKTYSGTNGAAKERSDLEAAKKIYEEFKLHPNVLVQAAIKKELKPDTGTFLDGWLSAFH